MDENEDEDDDYYYGVDEDLMDRFVLGDGTTASSRYRRKWQFYDTPADFWDLDFAENNAAAAAAAANMAGHSLTRYTTTRRGTKSHRRGSH
jgi:hypothetical protein